MGDAEELTLLRERYTRALAAYEAAASMLNRHFAAGTRPTESEQQRERDSRVELDQARRAFLEAWLPR